jgi:glutamate synthase domain-containing protein 3
MRFNSIIFIYKKEAISQDKMKKEKDLFLHTNDAESRTKRFVIVHELLRRHMVEKTSRKEKRVLNAWKPCNEDGLFPIPDLMDEREAELEVYRKVSESFFRDRSFN